MIAFSAVSKSGVGCRDFDTRINDIIFTSCEAHGLGIGIGMGLDVLVLVRRLLSTFPNLDLCRMLVSL